MSRIIKTGTGRALVYVWAFEQDGRFEGKYTNQDAYIPWKLAKRFRNGVQPHSGDKEMLRYYHLFKKGELEGLINFIPELLLVRSGYDHQNWWVEFSKNQVEKSYANDEKDVVDQSDGVHDSVVDRLDEFLDDVMNEIEADELENLKYEEIEDNELLEFGELLSEDVDYLDQYSIARTLDSVKRESEELLAALPTLDSAIDGMEKLKRRIQSECLFLQKLSSEDPNSTITAFSSNSGYYCGIVEVIRQHQGVVAVSSKFNYKPGLILKPTDELTIVPRGKSCSYCTVDVVSHSGLSWVKVRATQAKHISVTAQGGGEGEKNVLDVAKSLVECASQNPVNFISPQIVFYFSNGVSEVIAEKLRLIGVHIEGRIILRKLDVTSEPIMAHYDPPRSPTIDTLNFDVSTLLALVSDLTNNCTSTKYHYDVPSLASQAKSEQKEPVLPIILRYIDGKRWIITETALRRFSGIIDIIGGPNEKLRTEALLPKFLIVKDQPSKRSLELAYNHRETPETLATKKLDKQAYRNRGKVDPSKLGVRKQKKRDAWLLKKGVKEANSSAHADVQVESEDSLDPNFIIFGTGDQLRVPTITSNVSFIRSCLDKGVSFCVFLHGARALTERKAMLSESDEKVGN